MDEKPNHKSRPSFVIKKYTLLCMMAVHIVMLILYGVFSDQLADKTIEHMDGLQTNQFDRIKRTTVIIFIASSVILIPLQLLFMYGVYRENICLTTAYTVLSVLATMIATIQALSQPFFWGSALWVAMITVLVALFLRELNIINAKQSRLNNV